MKRKNVSFLHLQESLKILTEDKLKNGFPRRGILKIPLAIFNHIIYLQSLILAAEECLIVLQGCVSDGPYAHAGGSPGLQRHSRQVAGPLTL